MDVGFRIRGEVFVRILLIPASAVVQININKRTVIRVIFFILLPLFLPICTPFIFDVLKSFFIQLFFIIFERKSQALSFSFSLDLRKDKTEGKKPRNCLNYVRRSAIIFCFYQRANLAGKLKIGGEGYGLVQIFLCCSGIRFLVGKCFLR